MWNRLSLVAAAWLSVGAAAGAEVIRFSNASGTFDWVPRFPIHLPPGPTPYSHLDISQPATQSGGLTPIGIHWLHDFPTSSDVGVIHSVRSGASSRIARSTIAIPAPVNPPGTTDLFPPRSFGAGEAVGPGLNWQTIADLGWFRFSTGENYIVGSSFTMGVEITLVDGVHYGYVDFVLGSSQTYPTLMQYQPTGWGYETVAGVPIVVPAPGAGLIAIAFAAAIQRRRRERQHS